MSNESWYAKNKEKVKAYRIKNKEKIQKSQKEYRKNNKEKISELWKNWYDKNKTKSFRRRFTESRNKALKVREISWELSYEDYINIIKNPCYYCNNKLGPPVTRSCGLDRLDSNKGYEITNVVSCCYVCNCIKNVHLSAEETKIAAEAIINYRLSKS